MRRADDETLCARREQQREALVVFGWVVMRKSAVRARHYRRAVL